MGQVPFYPAFPIIALNIAVVSIVAMTIFNTRLALLYFVLLIVAYMFFKLFKKT